MPSDVPSSPRLTFRRMEAEDLDDLHRLLGDPAVMRYYPHPFSRDESAAWIERQRERYARDGLGLWALHDADGAFVGDCGLSWQVVDGVEDLEVGYHLLPEHQGRGLATEAATACREHARARGVRRLIAIVRPDNLPSRRVAERIGLAVERETTFRDVPVVLLSGTLGEVGA